MEKFPFQRNMLPTFRVYLQTDSAQYVCAQYVFAEWKKERPKKAKKAKKETKKQN